MRTYEIAAVKMAVKRSVRAGSIENGFQSLYEWSKGYPQAKIAEMLQEMGEKVSKRNLGGYS